jgi:hypothetical protein
MNTSGSIELGYASAAIIGALLEELIASKLISYSIASNVLDKADVSIKGLGNITSVPGALQVVKDVRAQLAKNGVR